MVRILTSIYLCEFWEIGVILVRGVQLRQVAEWVCMNLLLNSK